MRSVTFTPGTTGAAATEKYTFAKASEAATRETQNQLLDRVVGAAGVKNDAGLSRLLEVAPPVISKIRHKKLPVGATLAIAITEETDLSIADITAILAGHISKS